MMRRVSPVALAMGDYTEVVYYVYALKLANNRIYLGSSPDLRRRLEEHKHGKVLSTRKHRPFVLAFYCAFQDRLAALRFEKYLKSGSGFSFRKRHFAI